MNRLKEKYNKEIVNTLVKELKLNNIMQVPKLTKIVLNAGIGEFRDNREAVEAFVTDMAALAGQKPNPRKSRLSESGFKIRKGEVVGYSVTLRGEKMWTFLDKLISIVLPRVRDFRGLSLKSFDERGNYSFGLTEHVIFPEVNPNSVKGIRGLQVTVCVRAKDKSQSLLLLTELGIPFEKVKKK